LAQCLEAVSWVSVHAEESDDLTGDGGCEEWLENEQK
jgi:hypothetical protein